LEKCLLEFDLGRVVVIELENNIREPLEIRIDRAIDGDFRVAGIEAPLLRIVVADM